ncbi:FxLYD domain-containing protein [Aestuariimicrobium soli]|uniref:FxLYD domain-containing protein n=1 Tax=Aestuariimicrobium soli TaxID=2035834 RepID=UPI003EB6E86F
MNQPGPQHPTFPQSAISASQQQPGQQFPGQQFQGQQFQGQPFQGQQFQQPPKQRKPLLKRWWVWALGVVALIVVIASVSSGGDQPTAAPAEGAESSVVADEATASSAGTSASGAAKATNAAPPSQAAKPAVTKAPERLTLDKGWKLDKSNPYMVQVVGYVSNNTDKPIDNYVQITFSALDKNGANVGDCLANANTIDANGKWKFEAFCTAEADEVHTVRFKEITGF